VTSSARQIFAQAVRSGRVPRNFLDHEAAPPAVPGRGSVLGDLSPRNR